MIESVTISYADDYVLFNGEPIISIISLTALAASTDLNTIYVASAFPFVRKYVRSYNSDARVYDWALDAKFNISLPDDVPQYPNGLFLRENDLYITYSDHSNDVSNSKILKVNAANGSTAYALNTGSSSSVIYSADNTGLTDLVIAGSYLYALNTGNNNTGKWIDRVALSADAVSTPKFIQNLKLAPIQCAIYGTYLCVFETDLDSENQLVEIFNLADGSLAHTLRLNDAKNEKIGLSLDGSLLNLQDEYGIARYTFDLMQISSVDTRILDIIPYPPG